MSRQKDAEYNLRQFWAALEPAKKQAKTPQDWAEVYLLDSRSNSQLGHLLLIKAALRAKSAALYAVDITWGKAFALSVSGLGVAVLIPKVREFVAKSDPGINAYKASIQSIYNQANAAFSKAEALGKKSVAAYAKAKVQAPRQAAGAQAMGTQGLVFTANDQGSTMHYIDRSSSGPSLESFWSTVQTPVLGIPAWVWALGAVGVALWVTANVTPAGIAAQAAVKRATE